MESIMMLILLLTLEAITSTSVIAPTPRVTSHCAPEEQVVFSVRLRQASLAPLSRRAKLACRSLTTMFAISPSTVNTPPPSPRPVRLRVDCGLA